MNAYLKSAALIAMLLLGSRLPAQENVTFRLFLIGDAGKYTTVEETPALKLLQQSLQQHPNSAVVYLGDNIYDSGLTEEDYAEDRARLRKQLIILENYRGHAFFVPGNHDWNYGKSDALPVLKRQADEVNAFVRDSTSIANRERGAFFPARTGTPGPDTLHLGKTLILAMLDTQWFLHKRIGKEVVYEDGSEAASENAFWKEVEAVLKDAKQRNMKVAFVAHHPLFSISKHSKRARYMGMMDLVGRYRSQQLYGQGYRPYRDKMVALLQAYGDQVIYAAGHDHTLQYWQGAKGTRYIVSGAGSKRSPYYPKLSDKAWNEGAALIWPELEKEIEAEEGYYGFFELCFLDNGKLEVIVHQTSKVPLEPIVLDE